MAEPARRRVQRPLDDRVAFVSRLLELERRDCLSRHGSVAEGRELGGAICSRHDIAAACMGGHRSEWVRSTALTTGKVPVNRRLPSGVRAVSHRDDWILGNPVAEHAGLYAVWP